MILLTIYLSVTLVVVALWILVFRLPGAKRYSLLATVGDSLIVAIVWPLLVLGWLVCVTFDLCSPPRRGPN